MAAPCDLIAVGVLERDNHAETMCSWCYPTLGDLESVVIDRARMDEDEVPSGLMFSKFKNTWIYILPVLNSNRRILPAVDLFSIALVSKSFDPEKWGTLVKLMGQAYSDSGDPVRLLEGFLSVFAKGAWEAKSISGSSFGRFVDADFDPRMVMLQSSIKALVAQLGQESIYLWTAALCKKRIILHSASIQKLQHAVRAVPLFVWHRSSTWQQLRPLVNSESMVELAELKTSGAYIAGFTDTSVRDREDLYDLFVDLDASSFHIAEHAQNDFLLCSVHKDVAKYLMDTAGTGDSGDHQDMIKGLCRKTKEIVGKLESLKQDHGLGKPTVARQDLESLGGKNIDIFLWQVAVAESMTTG